MKSPDDRDRQTNEDDLLTYLAEAGLELPLPRPPEALTRSLEDLFQGQNPVVWSEAQLINDTRTGQQLVGSRGQGDQNVWTATYCAVNADIVLDGVYRHDGHSEISGQVFPLDSGSSAFRVTVEGPTSLSAYTDDLGQFELGALPPGGYTLRANNDRQGVVLQFDGLTPKPEADKR